MSEKEFQKLLGELPKILLEREKEGRRKDRLDFFTYEKDFGD